MCEYSKKTYKDIIEIIKKNSFFHVFMKTSEPSRKGVQHSNASTCCVNPISTFQYCQCYSLSGSGAISKVVTRVLKNMSEKEGVLTKSGDLQ